MVAVRNPDYALTEHTVTRCLELTPHDTNEITTVTAGIRVNVSGLVKLVFAGPGSASAVTLQLVAGVDYPYQIRQVFSTGTDAGVITGKIHGLY